MTSADQIKDMLKRILLTGPIEPVLTVENPGEAGGFYEIRVRAGMTTKRPEGSGREIDHGQGRLTAYVHVDPNTNWTAQTLADELVIKARVQFEGMARQAKLGLSIREIVPEVCDPNLCGKCGGALQGEICPHCDPASTI